MRLPLLSAVLVAAAVAATAGPAAEERPLVSAVKHGDIGAVRGLLKQGAEVDARQPDGMTALHWACYQGDAAITDVLLQFRADPNATTRFGVTPLALAIENRSTAIVDRLLAQRADANAAPGGQAPLHVAARVGDAAIVRSLLAAGAVVDRREEWQNATPLMIAASGRHIEVVRLLIQAKADVNARAAETSLFIGPGDRSTTYTQIPRGGMTPLMFAARDGCLACIRPLAEAGTNVNYEDPARVTPLNLAVYNGHFDTAAALLEAGANANDGSVYLLVDFRNLPADGVNADHHPLPHPADTLDALGLLKQLLARGAHPDHELLKELQSRSLGFERPQYLSGLTPLQRAAQQADLPAMQVLLDAGADPSLPNRGGSTPGGDTPLLWAIRSVGGVPSSILGNRPGKLAYRPRMPGDSLAAVRLLLDRKADINGADWSGNTPLHLAAVLGANDIVQLLADRGARLDAQNADGETALDVVTAAGRSGREGGRGRGRGTADTEATAVLLRRLMGLPPAASAAAGARP